MKRSLSDPRKPPLTAYSPLRHPYSLRPTPNMQSISCVNSSHAGEESVARMRNASVVIVAVVESGAGQRS